jgi:hypothetical protein
VLRAVLGVAAAALCEPVDVGAAAAVGRAPAVGAIGVALDAVWTDVAVGAGGGVAAAPPALVVGGAGAAVGDGAALWHAASNVAPPATSIALTDCRRLRRFSLTFTDTAVKRKP